MILDKIKNRIKLSLPGLYRFIKNIAGIFGFRSIYFTKKVSREDFFVKPDFDLNQFFFNKSTADFMVSLFDHYNDICCLCTPRLAHEWFERGRTVTLLDIDERFAYLPGYRYYDLRNPINLSAVFDVIIVDPPFFMAAHELRKAIDLIASPCLQTTLCLIYPVEREEELLAVFKEWNLQRTPLQNLQWNNIKGAGHSLNGFYCNCLTEIECFSPTGNLN
jgi:hypothetical protein